MMEQSLRGGEPLAGEYPLVFQEGAAGRFVIAEENGLQASDVRIVTAPIGDDSKSVSAQVAGSLVKLTRGKLKMTASEVTVSGRLQGKKWFWSVDRNIESTCVLKGGITHTDPDRRDHASSGDDDVVSGHTDAGEE